MNNKVLVTLIIPLIEKEYEVYLPANKRIGEIVSLLAKALVDVSNDYYQPNGMEKLYNRISGKEYDIRLLLKDTDIRNGSEVIFM